METQNSQAQVDRREVLAIIRAVERNRSLVLWYEDVVRELHNVAEGDFDELNNKLYKDIMEGRIKNVYGFLGPCSVATCDVVVVAPEALSKRQLNMIEELAKLYRFKGYDGNDEYVEAARTIHNVVKMWASRCHRMSDPAEAVYVLATSYGLVVGEEPRLNKWGVGKVYYKIVGLDAYVVKKVFRCSGCVDILMTRNYVGECTSWHFER